MLNYWVHLTELPDDNPAKIALNENITLRTNWIKTIEKLLITFDLIEVTRDMKNFSKHASTKIDKYYQRHWDAEIAAEDRSKLEFFKLIKTKPAFADHLRLTNLN